MLEVIYKKELKYILDKMETLDMYFDISTYIKLYNISLESINLRIFILFSNRYYLPGITYHKNWKSFNSIGDGIIFQISSNIYYYPEIGENPRTRRICWAKGLTVIIFIWLIILLLAVDIRKYIYKYICIKNKYHIKRCSILMTY